MLFHLKLYNTSSPYPFQILNRYHDLISDAVSSARGIIGEDYAGQVARWELIDSNGAELHTEGFTDGAPR